MSFLPSNHFDLDLGTVYLDAAATSQKPNQVIQSQANFYHTQNASTHSPHSLGQNLEAEVELTRIVVADFLGGVDSREIVFSSGATDSLNMVANGILFDFLVQNQFGIIDQDEILIWIGEHHANLLPWERLARLTNMRLVFFGMLANGQVDMEEYRSKLNSKTKLVCVSACSNVLGIINPIAEICTLGHEFGSIVIVDGTQIVAHQPVNLNSKTSASPDFFAFSGHKVYAPTGIGILWGRSKILAKLQPNKLGGDMVDSVGVCSNDETPKNMNQTQLKTIYKPNPHRLEAGTLNFAGIIGLKTAIEWLVSNFGEIEEHEQTLFEILKTNMQKLELESKITIYGDLNLATKIPLISFNIVSQSAFDVATLLDIKGFAVRSGQHCAGPLHDYFEINSSLRVSLAAWNTESEIMDFVRAVDVISQL